MDNIKLKILFLSFACLLISMAGIWVRGKRKQKEILKDVFNKLNLVASRVSARPEQTELFNGVSLGLDPAKGLLFYSSDMGQEIKVITLSESVPARVDKVMDSGEISLIVLSVTSVNGFPYNIPFYDWFLDSEKIKYDSEKTAYKWEEKINKAILDRASTRISPYSIY